MPATTADFDFGSISIFAPEPPIGADGGPISPARAGRIRANLGGGTPLAPPVQQRMEASFGHNFANVRIHADGESDLLNRSVGARAFTFGNDIFLGSQAAGAGAFGNDRLLAHELTHVVQQRGTESGIPTTVAPADAPGEREAAAIAHNVSTGTATSTPAQVATQSHGAVQRITAAPDAPAAQATPADIAAQNAFNVMDITHRLLRAIDQSDVKVVGSEPPKYGFGMSTFIYKRNVNVNDTVAALSNLTAAQVDEVKKSYQAHEGRTLETDLFGAGESGYASNLTDDQAAQIRALLGGTQAGVGASAEEQQAAATHAADARAAEVHRLLHGDLDDSDRERVLGLIRQDAKANAALIDAYARMGGNLGQDVFGLGIFTGQRAWKLLDGNTVGADTDEIGIKRARITGIDEEIAGLRKQISESLLFPPAGAPYEIIELQKERKGLVEEIEKVAERAGEEARAGAKNEAEAHIAAQTRVATVLGDPNATATLAGGTDAAAIRALATDDPVAKVAAQLHKSVQEDKLSAEQLTAALRGLRTEAEERAQHTFPKGDPRVEEETKRLAADYLGRLPAAYDSLTSGDETKFDALVADKGDDGDIAVNKALVQGQGRLSDVSELVLALSGDRKDMATVQRVLRDKSAAEIKDLRSAYYVATAGRSLDFDLFGTAPTTSGEKSVNYMGQMVNPETLQTLTAGKASGTDRLNLEDYMKRPDTEGGPEEVNYILSRAEREYQYTIDNRGATGWWRDTWGNETRDLLDETIKEVRNLHVQYCHLVGWSFLTDPTGENLALPEQTHTRKAHEIIQKMRLARATIRGDRAAYEKANAELRAMFEAVAMFVIQAALTALLTPAAAAVLEAVELGAAAVEAGVMTARIAKFAASMSVNVVSTVGANLAVQGSDYSLAMLKADLLSGLGGSIGGEAVEKMLGPVAKGLTDRLGTKVSTEIIGLAKTAGYVEGAAWAQGMEGDLSLQNLVKQHLIGKAAGLLTEGTAKVTGLAPEPGAGKTTAPAEHATPATPEPLPGGAQSEGPGRSMPGETTAPVKAGQPETVAKPEDSRARGITEEPTAERSPVPINEGENTQVDVNPNDPHQFPERAMQQVGSVAEGQALYERMLQEDPARDVMVYRNTETGEVRVGWGASGRPLDVKAQMDALGGKSGTWEVEAQYSAHIPEGSVMWAKTRAETQALYEHSTAVDPYREVSVQQTDGGETRVVQGNEKTVTPDQKAREDAMMGEGDEWWSPEHYHPLNPKTNSTPEAARYPTTAGGDFASLESASRRLGGHVARTARVRHWVKRGERYVVEYTDYTYDPTNPNGPYTIEYNDPQTGARMPPETFRDLAAYEQWYADRFPGWRLNVNEPSSGTAPAPHAPTENENGPGGPKGDAPSTSDDRFFTPDEVTSAVEGIQPAEDVAQTRVAWVPGAAGEAAERAIMPITNPETAQVLFERSLREAPNRDIAIGRNSTTNEVTVWRARPGEPLDVEAQMRALGGTWEVESVYRAHLPEGSAMQGSTPAETRGAYAQSMRDDPYREVAIYRNVQTGEVMIGQGGAGQQGFDLQVQQEALPGPPGSWELEAHYHRIDPQTGVTLQHQRLPSGTNGDFSAIEWESQHTGNRPRTSRIDIVTEHGPDYTEFSYDPSDPHPYKINYPDPRSGARVPLEFETLRAYEEWYSTTFPGRQATDAVAAPAQATEGAIPPVQMPGKAVRAPSARVGSDEQAREEFGGFEDEPTQTGFDFFPDEPTIVDHEGPAARAQTPTLEDILRLARGEDTTPVPATAEEIARSNAEVEAAQKILADPTAKPQQVQEAIRTIAERAIAQERTVQSRLEKASGVFRTLSASDVRGMCVGGRDVSAEAILALIGNSPHEIRIERMQAAHLGIKTEGLGARHAFAVVTLADGTRFLIDPTFAQFADFTGASENFTAGHMLSNAEGLMLARDLMRDGMVPLTDEAARQYVMGLGATPADAEAATARLMSGGASLLTEIVRNGQVERFAGRPEEAYDQVNTVSEAEMSSLRSLQTMLNRMPADHPARPLIQSLLTQFERLATYLPPIPDPSAGSSAQPPHIQ